MSLTAGTVVQSDLKKKLNLRGASHPHSILKRRRPSNAGRETPRTPALSDLGSGAISWNRYPLGRETVTPGRARLTTQPKLSGAQRGGFFPTGGEIRPGGGSNPSPVECRRLLRTTRANNLRRLTELKHLYCGNLLVVC